MNPPSPRPSRIGALVLTLALVAAACGGNDDAEASGDPAPDGFPVTVQSCGEAVTFDAPPERAAVNDNNMVEMMFALDLTDRMVAYGGAGVRVRLDRFSDDYDALEFLGEDYVAFEPLIGTAPDFFFAGWNYGFSESTGITPDELASFGISTYVLSESCRRVDDSLGPATIESAIYQDLRNLGLIFGVSDRAEALVDEFETRLARVEERLPPADERTARVMALLSGDETAGTAPGLTIVPDLYRRAGAVNVFEDLPEMWGRVSWEEVVDRDPEVIIVTDYGGSAEGQRGVEKMTMLREHPGIAEVSAIRDDRLLAFPQTAVNPGIRFIEGIETLAAYLYPDRFADLIDDPDFGLPDRGTGTEGLDNG